MTKPRKGTRGSYQVTAKHAPVPFTVIGTEGNICWARYDTAPDNPSCFIWRHPEGLNPFHTWPGKEEPCATSTQ